MNIEQKLAQAEKLLNEVKDSLDKLDITGPCILEDLTKINSIVVIGKYDPTPVLLSVHGGTFHATISKRENMDFFRDKKRFRRLDYMEVSRFADNMKFILGGIANDK